jgi:hypothetical protein
MDHRICFHNVDRIKKWTKAGKTVIIFTARANDKKAIKAIKDWLKDNELPDLKITNIKTPDIEEFWDDRAIQVQKNTGKTINEKIVTETQNLDWQKYLLFTPKTGGEYYTLSIPVGVEPPMAGSKFTLNGVRVVSLKPYSPEDIARGRGGPIANSMREHGVAYRVNCLPEGHKQLKNIKILDENMKNIALAGLLGISGLATPSQCEEIKKPLIQDVQIDQNTQTIDDIARTLWGEARGETVEGIDAVATVIYNRAKGDPNKMSKVVKAPKQFSIWNNSSKPVVRLTSSQDKQIWQYCQYVAKSMVNKKFQPLGTWNHYYNPKKAKPAWGTSQRGTHIGNHKFMTL